MLNKCKLLDLDHLTREISELKASGKRVVHCHGVFDVLHIGHIKHFKGARKFGDALVVTVTPDRFVNKGQGRPVFGEGLRAEVITALACVDHVTSARPEINLFATKRMRGVSFLAQPLTDPKT
jgi:cytidyltransferase-like protein